MTVCADLVGVSTRARLVPRRALLDQRDYGALLDQRDYGALLGQRDYGALLDQCRNSPSADRVADEERGGVSRSGDGLRGLGWGLDTCPARSSPGTTRPAEVPALLGQRRNSSSAHRVADEERGGVSRSSDSPRRLGRGLDTCPARSSPGTTRPAEPQLLRRRALLDQRNHSSFVAGHYSTNGPPHPLIE